MKSDNMPPKGWSPSRSCLRPSGPKAGRKSDQYFVYITTNHGRHTVLYVGITSDLARRSWQHKNKVMPGFTKKYNADKLVYYEAYSDPAGAIAREKQVKNLLRRKKIELIERSNPEWKDLYDTL